jgi:hypothetical protein
MTSSHAWLMEWFMALGLPHITCIYLYHQWWFAWWFQWKIMKLCLRLLTIEISDDDPQWNDERTAQGNWKHQPELVIILRSIYSTSPFWRCIYINNSIYIYIFERSGNGSKALGPCSSPPHLTPREEYWHSNIVTADGQMWFDICPNRLLGFLIGQGKFGLALHSCFHVVMTDFTRSWQGGWGFPKSIEMHYVNHVINV